jgi:hypothetical protein
MDLVEVQEAFAVQVLVDAMFSGISEINWEEKVNVN